MTETEEPNETRRPPPGPLVPRPAVTAIALAIAAGLLWHMYYDATHLDYDGGKITILLGSIVLFTLGFDIGKWFRGGSS